MKFLFFSRSLNETSKGIVNNPRQSQTNVSTAKHKKKTTPPKSTTAWSLLSDDESVSSAERSTLLLDGSASKLTLLHSTQQIASISAMRQQKEAVRKQLFVTMAGNNDAGLADADKSQRISRMENQKQILDEAFELETNESTKQKITESPRDFTSPVSQGPGPELSYQMSTKKLSSPAEVAAENATAPAAASFVPYITPSPTLAMSTDRFQTKFRSSMSSFDKLDRSTLIPLTPECENARSLDGLDNSPPDDSNTTDDRNNDDGYLCVDSNKFQGWIMRDDVSLVSTVVETIPANSESTNAWMKQWREIQGKVGVALTACQPCAGDLSSERSEFSAADLIRNKANSFWQCMSPAAAHSNLDINRYRCNDGKFLSKANRYYYNKIDALRFIHQMTLTGATLLYMQPPNKAQNSTGSDWRGCSVQMALEPGNSGDTAVPRLEWMSLAGGAHSELLTCSLNLLEIMSINSREDVEYGNESNDDKAEEYTSDRRVQNERHLGNVDDNDSYQNFDDRKPLDPFTCVFTITSKFGDVHVFEAASARDRNNVRFGIQNIIAWLSFVTISGDAKAATFLFSELPTIYEDKGTDCGELPMLSKQPQCIAMNRTAHFLLD